MNAFQGTAAQAKQLSLPPEPAESQVGLASFCPLLCRQTMQTFSGACIISKIYFDTCARRFLISAPRNFCGRGSRISSLVRLHGSLSVIFLFEVVIHKVGPLLIFDDGPRISERGMPPDGQALSTATTCSFALVYHKDIQRYSKTNLSL